MSSAAKGSAFETGVFQVLARELHSGRLGLLSSKAQVYQKKAYYSRDRQAFITTDVSIEISLEPGSTPLLIWIFECKDYGGPIPVDDLEEFHAKLQQIGDHNTKGTIVTRTALQRGALAFAMSKGIGVIRLLPDANIKHVLYLMQRYATRESEDDGVDWSEFETALLDDNHQSQRDFFASDDGYWMANWFSVLSHVMESLARQ